MIWISPSEKDPGNAALEKRLWDAAQFRDNSGLKELLKMHRDTNFKRIASS